MKYYFATAALLAATVSADDCKKENGNFYCNEVRAITYSSVGGSGTYNQVASMNNVTGECTSQPFAYSGSLAPFAEEVSIHIRGPVKLDQFAFYTPGPSYGKTRRSEHVRRHAHGHNHGHARAHQKRAVGDEVVATINGQIVSWINEYSGEAATTPAAAPTPASTPATNALANLGAGVAAAVDGAVQGVGNVVGSALSGLTGASSYSGTQWGRSACYTAASKQAEGLSFLNNRGGAGSGVFDMKFGNSLSYASADGKSCASQNTVLAETTLGSDDEIILMTDKKCSGDDCGFYRWGTEAVHGFSGESKAFFFEFSMPDDGTTGWNANMPALWMLNAEIPRTLQYGKAECSCWTSGCGEFDIFEVLDSGNTKAKSTLHGNIAGGCSDYFARPTSGSIFLALVMYNNNIHIKILDGPVDFGEEMANSVINDIISSTSTASKTVSLFALAGAAGDSTA